MTDQIPAGLHPDDVALARDYAARVLADPDYHSTEELAAARVLQALLPTPPPPTLADMSPEERSACRWMQADHPEYGRVIVLRVDDDGDPDAYRVLVLEESGEVARPAGSRVTPRPDLPRMTWPGDTPEAPAPAPPPALPDGWKLADHPDHGRVIVTTENQDGDGYVGFVHRADYINSGHGTDWCKPAELTYLDQGADQ